MVYYRTCFSLVRFPILSLKAKYIMFFFSQNNCIIFQKKYRQKLNLFKPQTFHQNAKYPRNLDKISYFGFYSDKSICDRCHLSKTIQIMNIVLL